MDIDIAMYSSFQLAFKYLNYYLTSSNGRGHGIHSPFVFDFVTKILNDKNEYEDYIEVENLRQKLLRNNAILPIEDYGAGSSASNSHQRSVASVAKHAVKSKKYSQLLYRVVKYFQPGTIIELGTSLGITTSYLALARPGSNVFTLEGATELAHLARENFTSQALTNVRVIQGNFDFTLPAVLYHLPVIDFAFIDGNHRREPTLNYFNQILAKSSSDSIFILDDIHWSMEMEQAWDAIKEYPAVRCTIDLFFMGFVFLRPQFVEKQHFVIRF